MLKKIDHIGIAVKDLDKTVQLYTRVLGLELEGVHKVDSFQVRTAFFPVGESHLELIEPTPENKGVLKFLEKRGEGIHHICFLVDDIQKALDTMTAQGVELIDKAPRQVNPTTKAAFVHPKSTGGVLVELYEKS
jgi:methylmalonyl-CoA epimerase